MNRRELLTGAAYIGVSLLCAPAGVADAEGLVVGKPAIDFSLKDLNGKVRSLKAEKGRVVVVNFWATWCGPCRHELPLLHETYTRLKDQPLTIFAVSVDDPSTLAKVKPWVTEKKLTFPILMDSTNEVVMKYNPEGIVPYTVLIDAQGNLRHIHSGYNPGDETRVEAEIRALLAPLAPKGGKG